MAIVFMMMCVGRVDGREGGMIRSETGGDRLFAAYNFFLFFLGLGGKERKIKKKIEVGRISIVRCKLK